MKISLSNIKNLFLTLILYQSSLGAFESWTAHCSRLYFFLFFLNRGKDRCTKTTKSYDLLNHGVIVYSLSHLFLFTLKINFFLKRNERKIINSHLCHINHTRLVPSTLTGLGKTNIRKQWSTQEKAWPTEVPYMTLSYYLFGLVILLPGKHAIMISSWPVNLTI